MAVGVGASFIVSGIIGCCINSYLMSKWRKFKLYLIIYCIGTTVAYFLTFLFAYLEKNVLLLIFAGLLGLFEVPTRGHEIAFMCEVGYPVSIFLIS